MRFHSALIFSYLSVMNMQNIRPSKYLRYLALPTLFGTQRTKEILNVNPTIVPEREEAQQVSVFVFDYNTRHYLKKENLTM